MINYRNQGGTCMAESYISELGDKLSHGVANTDGSRVKIIAPKLYTDGNSHPSIATALAGKASSTHTHGNIANGGTLTDTAAAAAGNDYVVIRDADNAKIQTSTIKGTDVADAVSKKHSHSTLTLSTTAQAYDGSHTLALPSTDPYTSARTPASHAHGNIANGGTLTDTAAAAAGNDYVVIRDADNAKIQTSTIKGTDVADAVSKKHSHSTLTLSTTAQAYDGTHTLALPSTDPYTSARTPASHTHGNIQNGGTLQTNDVAIASGDKLVITDSSDSSKVARASISFDGSTATKALTQKGTWETFNNYTHPTTSGNKHVPSGGSSGQFLGWSADGTAAWVANPNTDTKVTSSANHYTPATASGSDKTASASGATAAWSIDVVKGVTLNTDGKGHVTGLSVTSGKIPANPNTDTKVTSSANHYTPATASGSDVTASATGATAAWSIDVVKGVTLNTDGKGHVTGMSVTSGKIPGNPNTDTKVKATAKTDNVNYKILATASASPTSGNATEAVYDTDITLNPSTNTIAANISGNAAKATVADSVSTAIGSGEIKLLGVANNVAGNYQPKMHPNIRAYYDNNSNGNILLIGPERGTRGAADRGGIRLSGGTGYYTQLQTVDFTADRWHKLPDESGNLAITSGTYPNMSVGTADYASAAKSGSALEQAIAPDADVSLILYGDSNYSTVKALYNAGKKLYLVTGGSIQPSGRFEYRIPLTQITYDANLKVNAFYFEQSQDDRNGASEVGSIAVYRLDSTGWTMSAKQVGYAVNSGAAVTYTSGGGIDTALQGKMSTDGSNATNVAGGNIIRSLKDWSNPDDAEMIAAASSSGQGKYTLIKLWDTYLKPKADALYARPHIFKSIPIYSTQDSDFHSQILRKQLGPRYTQGQPFILNGGPMFFNITANFINIEFSNGLEYTTIEFEVFNTLQSGITNIGRKLASIAMILHKGTSSISLQIPFTWSSGSFAATLYCLLGNRITAGSANVTSYYYGFAV